MFLWFCVVCLPICSTSRSADLESTDRGSCGRVTRSGSRSGRVASDCSTDLWCSDRTRRCHFPGQFRFGTAGRTPSAVDDTSGVRSAASAVAGWWLLTEHSVCSLFSSFFSPCISVRFRCNSVLLLLLALVGESYYQTDKICATQFYPFPRARAAAAGASQKITEY